MSKRKFSIESEWERENAGNRSTQCRSFGGFNRKRKTWCKTFLFVVNPNTVSLIKSYFFEKKLFFVFWTTFLLQQHVRENKKTMSEKRSKVLNKMIILDYNFLKILCVSFFWQRYFSAFRKNKNAHTCWFHSRGLKEFFAALNDDDERRRNNKLPKNKTVLLERKRDNKRPHEFHLALVNCFDPFFVNYNNGLLSFKEREKKTRFCCFARTLGKRGTWQAEREIPLG